MTAEYQLVQKGDTGRNMHENVADDFDLSSGFPAYIDDPILFGDYRLQSLLNGTYRLTTQYRKRLIESNLQVVIFIAK